VEAVHRRTTYLLLAICVGHVLLISAQVQSKSGLPVIETVTFAAFAKLQQGLGGVTDGTSSLWRNYIWLKGVAQENVRLKQRNLELEGQIQQAQALAIRTKALEEALAMQATMPSPVAAARVIAGDPAPGSLTITIDRGSSDGIETDMAVIATRGLVGRVINRPLPHAAQVQLLTGRNAAAAVMFERTGAGGIAAGGSGDPPLRVELVPNASEIKVGDRVLTSGQDGLFPRGFVVGTVERAESRAGQWTVAVRPAVDFSQIDVVLVVLEKPDKPAKPGAGSSRSGKAREGS
jgi:rod shape-determining protein MreC